MTVSEDLTRRFRVISGDGAQLRLRLLATSDLHVHLFPFNYYTDRRDDNVGLAGVATLLEGARAETPNTLLFDNGDTIQGSPLGDAAMSEPAGRGKIHPMIAAMNALGYDAATIGNHDFDFGLDAVNAMIEGAAYPIVMANARRVHDGDLYCPGHVILTRHLVDTTGRAHRLRVGVTGAVPPQTAQWAQAHLEGRVKMEAILPSVAREVALLRTKGVDLVVVLAHSGLGDDSASDESENVAGFLAQIHGVDAVIAGHTHEVFPQATDAGSGLIHGTPVVQPGCWGSHLGVIDLTLRASVRYSRGHAHGFQSPQDARDAGPLVARHHTATLEWDVVQAEVHVRDARKATLAERKALRRNLLGRSAFRKELARAHRMTRAYSARPLGHTAVPLETYFSLVAPCPATQMVADAKQCGLAPLLKGRPEFEGLPVLAAVAPFKAGGRNGSEYYTDIPAGPLLLRNAADLYVYSNGATVVLASGAQIRDWLERSAAAFHTIRADPSGPPQRLLRSKFASYNFDALIGLRYSIDLTQRSRSNARGDRIYQGPGRVRDICLADGTPLRETDKCLVITNSFRAAGGGMFPSAAAARQVISSPNPVRNLLMDYIVAADGALAPTADPTWRFSPLGGTPVLFETGTGARAHAGRAAELGLERLATSDNGLDDYLMHI
ncbi:MAG: 5'-nucleotidase C-terminal domain-containing protein [Roseicyclus sp.]